MTVYFRDGEVTVYGGDCLDVIAGLGADSVDAVVTDPPYGLDFMGKAWDSFEPPRFQAWCMAWASECLRVLKPGGYLLAFGGTRTWHRLTCGIEDAGFEIRDSVAWLYGSGFPKSLDVSKAIDKAAGAEREVVGVKQGRGAAPVNDMRGGNYRNGAPSGVDTSAVTAPATEDAARRQGWGTALKPAFEPIVVARKPLSGTVASNVVAYGTGALNIDACRVGTADTLARPFNEAGNDVYGKFQRFGNPVEPAGRWPANVVLDGDMADELDKQTPNMTITGHRTERSKQAKVERTNWLSDNHQSREYPDDDGGGASRFFPTFRYTAKAPTAQRPSADGVSHPTVKPLDLMRWLVRLVTPPGGLVLDPFAGSGTVGEAAIHEHKRALLIEREPTYLPLIVTRLSKPMAVGFDFEGQP